MNIFNSRFFLFNLIEQETKYQMLTIHEWLCGFWHENVQSMLAFSVVMAKFARFIGKLTLKYGIIELNDHYKKNYYIELDVDQVVVVEKVETQWNSYCVQWMSTHATQRDTVEALMHIYKH